MWYRNSLPPVVAAALCCSLAQAGPALDEIVVTAQKTEQTLQEVPIAISAMSADFLARNHIDDLDLIGNVTPGLHIQQQAVTDPSINIRGITSDSAKPNEDPTISVYIDGVDSSRREISSAELFDLQRVELLKGPQATLFGTAAQIGAIHFISQRPTPEFDALVSVGIGNFGYDKQQAMVNGGLGEHLAARLAVSRRQRDGYVRNISDGARFMGTDTRAWRGSLLWTPLDDLSVTLIASQQRDRPDPVAFISQVIPKRDGSLDPFWRTDVDVGRDAVTTRDVDRLTIDAEWTLGDAYSLRWIGGVVDYDTHSSADADGSRYNIISWDRALDGDQQYQELRLSFDNGGWIKAFGGVTYFSEQANQRTALNFNEGYIQGLMGLDLIDANGDLRYVPALDHTISEVQYQTGERRSLSTFADVTWSLSDRLDLITGLRWARDDKRFFINQPLPADGDRSHLAPGNLLFPATDGRLHDSARFNAVQPRLVLKYQFDDGAQLWAGYNEGYKSGTVDFDNQSPTKFAKVEPEKLRSYEVGVKSRFGENVEVSASVFDYDWTNFQTQVSDTGSPGSYRTVNAGRASATGAEISVNAMLNEYWQVNAEYAYTDGRYDDFQSGGKDLSGNRFRLSPKTSYSLGATYRTDWLGWQLLANLNYNYRSKMYFTPDNIERESQAGYGLVNARVSATSPDARWTVALWGNNLGNKKYLIDAGNTGESFGSSTVIVGAPRFYGLDIDYHLGK